MATAPNYDVMDLEESEPAEEGASDLDAEFLMHAEEAGFTEAQAKALKLAIERCVALGAEGAYAEDDAEDLLEE